MYTSSSCCWSAMWCRQRSLSSLRYWRGTTPPLRLRGGDITPPFLHSIAVIYCGLTAKRDR